MRGINVHKPSIQVMVVMAAEQPTKPAFLFSPAMRRRAMNRPAMHHAQEPEPKLVEFSNHGGLLCDDAEHIGDFGGEFDVVAQIRFRLFAIALPQFREGFAIAVLGPDAKMLGDGVQ